MKLKIKLITGILALLPLSAFGGGQITAKDISETARSYEAGVRPTPVSNQELISGVAEAQVMKLGDMVGKKQSTEELELALLDALTIYADIGTKIGSGERTLGKDYDREMRYFDLLGYRPIVLGEKGLTHPFEILNGMKKNASSEKVAKRIEDVTQIFTSQLKQYALARISTDEQQTREERFQNAIEILNLLDSDEALNGLFEITEKSFHLKLKITRQACRLFLKSLEARPLR